MSQRWVIYEQEYLCVI